MLQEVITTKVSLRTISPGSPTLGMTLDVVEIGDIAGDDDIDNDVETTGDHRGRIYERKIDDRCADLNGCGHVPGR